MKPRSVKYIWGKRQFKIKMRVLSNMSKPSGIKIMDINKNVQEMGFEMIN